MIKLNGLRSLEQVVLPDGLQPLGVLQTVYRIFEAY